MKSQVRVKVVLMAGLFSLAIALVAVGQPNIALPPGPKNQTPGWNHGRLNCGVNSIQPWSLKACLACCQRWYDDDSNGATLTDLFHCQTYCHWLAGTPGTVVTN